MFSVGQLADQKVKDDVSQLAVFASLLKLSVSSLMKIVN